MRVKNSVVTRARRKKVLKRAKGYFGSKHLLFKSAKEQVMHSLHYAYVSRRTIKRDYRKLWIVRINAACRNYDMNYSTLMHGLKLANVEINRKMLSEIAINDPKMFSEFVKVAKDGKAGKITKSTEVIGREVTINGAKATKKTEEKKVAKKEVKEETVDYSKMTVAELKEVAASKNISVAGLKKTEIIEALTK